MISGHVTGNAAHDRAFGAAFGVRGGMGEHERRGAGEGGKGLFHWGSCPLRRGDAGRLPMRQPVWSSAR
jgi:hypothetical protein